MLYAAIDYSLTSPAVCCYNGSNHFPPITDCQISYLTSVKKYIGVFDNWTGYPHPTYDHQCDRYNKIASWVIDCIRLSRSSAYDMPLVFIEDYGYSANGRITDLAEHTGTLKNKLWQMGIPFTTKSVTSVKKVLTGKGNSSKMDISEYYIKEIPTGFPMGKSPSADCIDAYGVLLAGLDSR
jgi:Holliday junction resolvasome RuvABC endonuclease subunit